MHRNHGWRRYAAPLGALACCVALSGCANGWGTEWFLIRPDPDRDVAEAPSTRIRRAQELGARVPRMSAEEQQQATEELASALRGELNPNVRMALVRTVALLPTAQADDLLKAALNDPDVNVQIAACESWGRRGTPLAVHVLADVLQNQSHRDVRLAAARALGDMPQWSGKWSTLGHDGQLQQQAIAALGAALDDTDVALQRRAMLALEHVTGRYYGEDVEAWRQFVQGVDVPPKKYTVAERVRRWLE
jgi:HEAT repeat protein